MHKLLALYTNEMIKISKKVSVLVMLAIMAVIIFGFGGLVKYQESSYAQNNSNTDYNAQFQREEMNRQLESAKSIIAEIQEKKKSAEGDELQALEAQLEFNRNQADMLQYAIDKDIILYTSSYRSRAAEKLFSYKTDLAQLEKLPENELPSDQVQQMSKLRDYVDTLEKVIEKKDFKAFIALLNDEINNNQDIPGEEKKIQIESNELLLKYNITGENGSESNYNNANAYINQITNGKLSLLYDVEYNNGTQDQKPLSPEMREKTKNLIAVSEYKLKNLNSGNSDNSANPISMDSSTIISTMLSIGIFVVVILVMILAGGSISSEVSTGSIKSLIISPVKRWKIFTAKVLSLLTVGIISALTAYVFSAIAYGIFFGFNTGAPYIYAKNGVAHELDFYMYHLARLGTDFIMVIVFIIFALMLSILTRNTAASVAISIAVFFVGSQANEILMRFVKGEWRKFIPFNNLNITAKVFSDTAQNTMPWQVNNSLAFSLIYLAVFIICMGYTALDSFNRRDIK